MVLADTTKRNTGSAGKSAKQLKAKSFKGSIPTIGVQSTEELNTSLSSLQWLQVLGNPPKLKHLKSRPTTPLANTARAASKSAKLATVQDADEETTPVAGTITLSPGKMLRVPRQAKSSNAGNSSDGENIDYNQDSDVKPPHSYAMLIFMAMRHHGSGKVTLAQIYEFILGHFGYYRVADPGWKNSIRHNLTQHKCFLKIARKQGESGKGGFWALDKSYEAMFEGGQFKGAARRMLSRKPAASNTKGSKSKGRGKATPSLHSRSRHSSSSSTSSTSSSTNEDWELSSSSQTKSLKIKFPKMLSAPIRSPKNSRHFNLSDITNVADPETGRPLSRSLACIGSYLTEGTKSGKAQLPTSTLSEASSACSPRSGPQVVPAKESLFAEESYDYLTDFCSKDADYDDDEGLMECERTGTLALFDTATVTIGTVPTGTPTRRAPTPTLAYVHVSSPRFPLNRTPMTPPVPSDYEYISICSPVDLISRDSQLRPPWAMV